MKKIVLKSLFMQNFKSVPNMTIDFSQDTKIFGRNGAGKTTIEDAFLFLLFGCDSQYSQKFDVRTLKNGEQVHNIDITVRATIEIDDVEYILSKTQKEIWVKHKGNENAEFEGNKNEFSINGYPKSDKDYKKFISEVIGSIDVFKMLIDPRYFSNMAWKDQRKIVMSFFNESTDFELASQDEKYEKLLPELNIASTDDIKNKYSKEKKLLQDELKEIPVRIDELNNSKIDIDISSIEQEKKELTQQLNGLFDSKNNSNSMEVNLLQQRKNEIEQKIMSIKHAADMELLNKKGCIQKQISELENNEFNFRNKILNMQSRKSELEKLLVGEDTNREVLGKEYYAQKEAEFDFSIWELGDDSDICPNCGQKLPPEKIKEMHQIQEKNKSDAKANFEKKKSERMKDLVDKGNASKQLSAQYEEEIKTIDEQVVGLNNSLTELLSKKDELLSSLSNLPMSANLSSNDDFIALNKEMAEIDNHVSNTSVSDTSAIDLQIDELENKIQDCNRKIALHENNSVIDKRIDKLRQEQIEVSQKIADCERMLFVLDEFVRYKLNLISDSVNKHFKNVSIKLFNTQINGGISETCEITYGENKVPYASLNNGFRIIAGLEVITALNQIYQINAPIFMDNAESINTDNIPKLDNQLIRMYVTDKDTDLRVETE